MTASILAPVDPIYRRISKDADALGGCVGWRIKPLTTGGRRTAAVSSCAEEW
jgi:hypothetical protein